MTISIFGFWLPPTEVVGLRVDICKLCIFAVAAAVVVVVIVQVFQILNSCRFAYPHQQSQQVKGLSLLNIQAKVPANERCGC